MKRWAVFGTAAVALAVGAGVAFAFLSDDLPGEDPLIVVPGIMATWPQAEYDVMVNSLVVRRFIEGMEEVYAPLIDSWYPQGGYPSGWGNWQIANQYDEWREALVSSGYVLGETAFLYPYWGLDSVGFSAAGLGRLVDHVRQVTGSQEVDLVAHSMGGVVARAYASTSRAVGSVDQLVTFGTPHHGTPAAYTAWEGGTVERFFNFELGEATSLGNIESGVKEEIFAEILEEYLARKASILGYKSWFQSPEDPEVIAAYIHDHAPGVQDLLSTEPYLWDRDEANPREGACQDQNAYPVNEYLCGLFNQTAIANLSQVELVSVFVDDLETDYGYQVLPSFFGLWRHGDPRSFWVEVDLDVRYNALLGPGDGKIPAASSQIQREMFELTRRSWASDCLLDRSLKHVELATSTAEEMLAILRRDMCAPISGLRLPQSDPRDPAVPITDPPSLDSSLEAHLVVCLERQIGASTCVERDQALTIDLSERSPQILRFDATGTSSSERWTVVWSINGRTASTSPAFYWDPALLEPDEVNHVLLEVTDVYGATSAAGTKIFVMVPDESQPESPNHPPNAQLWICYDTDCVGNSGALATESGNITFDALADNGDPNTPPDPSSDPDGDPLGFEWLINGELVSHDASFTFDAATLNPGANSVLLRVGDDKAAVSEAGATIIIPAELCRETMEPPLGPLGSHAVDGPAAPPGVVSRAEIIVDESGDYLNWPITIELYDSGANLLHEVGGLSRATLFGVDQPLARGVIVDATGDNRPDAVVCLGGTFNGGWDVQVLVISDHAGRWQTVLDEVAVNGVINVIAPTVTITETRVSMLGACTDTTVRVYEFAGTTFQFGSEATTHDWTIPDCDPNYSPPTTSLDNPHNMIVSWTDLGVGPGGTIEVDGPPDENSNVVFSVDCYDAECPLYFWYIDDIEVGRGDYVLVEASQIREGTHEVRMVFNEPEGFPWEGVVTLIRVHP